MEQLRPPTKRLRIFLRDFRMVEAAVNIAEGQTLTSFFSHRRNYLNLRSAKWIGTRDRADHAVLRIDQVLWAAAPDGDVLLTHVSQHTSGHPIELQLDYGLRIRAALSMSDHQRLSDYLETAGFFVPLLDAKLLRSGRPPKEVNVHLGDIVLNQAGIQAAWQVTVPGHGPSGDTGEHGSGAAQWPESRA
jgi:hypothetical protein